MLTILLVSLFNIVFDGFINVTIKLASTIPACAFIGEALLWGKERKSKRFLSFLIWIGVVCMQQKQKWGLNITAGRFFRSGRFEGFSWDAGVVHLLQNKFWPLSCLQRPFQGHTQLHYFCAVSRLIIKQNEFSVFLSTGIYDLSVRATLLKSTDFCCFLIFVIFLHRQNYLGFLKFKLEKLY